MTVLPQGVPLRPAAGKPLCKGPSASTAATSMIFSLEVEDSPFAAQQAQLQTQAQLQLLEQSLQPLLQPRGAFHRKLLRDVLLYQDILLMEEGEVDGVVLASKLTTAGYRVAVRQALGGGQGTAVFSNLRHSFLLVTAQDCPCAGIDFIVEPHFRDQFEISVATPRYSGLLAMLPPVMVGTAAQLTPLVQLLCAEMSLAFEQHGLSLPPWRQSRSLLSKWLPSKARDYDVSPYASPRGPSPEPSFQLAASGALQPLDTQPSSEAASGTVTPGFVAGDDDASPRAVLRSASAALMCQQAGGDRPKSLLSFSLASSKRQSQQQEVQGQSAAAAEARCSSGALDAASSAALSTPHQHQQEHPSAGLVQHRRGSGMTYRVSSEWQQPAIRTVKMQGQQQASSRQP